MASQRPVIVSVVNDGQAAIFEADATTGQAEQIARVRVPVDFPNERAVALTLAITGILDEAISVSVEEHGARRQALPPAPQHRSPKGQSFSSTDLLTFMREQGPMTAAEMAAHFGCDAHTIHNRIRHIRGNSNGRIRQAGNHRWEYVPREQAQQQPQPKTHGRPAKPTGTLYMRLVEVVRRHPDGVTTSVIADEIGLDSTHVSANLAFAVKRGYVRKIVAAHPDGNSSRKLSTWFPADDAPPDPVANQAKSRPYKMRPRYQEVLRFIEARGEDGAVTAEMVRHFDVDASRDLSSLLQTAAMSGLLRIEKFEERGREKNRYYLTDKGRERIEGTSQLAMETD